MNGRTTTTLTVHLLTGNNETYWVASIAHFVEVDDFLGSVVEVLSSNPTWTKIIQHHIYNGGLDGV